MAELSIPYARRQLARPAPGGGGGGGGGAVAQPRVPDVSSVYTPVRQIGQELDDVAATLGAVNARQQRARDVAALTEFETGFSEALGVKAEELKADQRVHPDDYYPLLSAYREELLQQSNQSLPGRLLGAAKAKAFNGTERLMIGMKAEGAKRAVERYTQSYDLYMDQQERDYLNATDQSARDKIGQKMRDKTVEYIQAGTFSPEDAALRLQKSRDKIKYAGLEVYAQQDPKGFLAQADKGALNNLPGEMRVKLIDKAQSERREQAAWQDAEDHRAERAVAAQQAVNSSEVRAKVYAMRGGPQAIALINAERAAGRLSEGDHAAQMGFAINLQNHQASLANMAASRAAANAQRADIIQRRKDSDDTGKLFASYLDHRPGPDGQMVTAESINGMLASGKYNGTVTGELAQRVWQHESTVANQMNTQKGQAYQRVLQNAEAAFEQNGLFATKQNEVNAQWALYREELTNQVFQGNKDPNAVNDEILGRYINETSSIMGTRMTPLIQSLPPAYQPSPVVGIEPAMTKLQEDFQAGTFGTDQAAQERYNFLARKLRELEQYPAFLLEAQKRKNPPPVAPPTPPKTGYLERVGQQQQAVTEEIRNLRNLPGSLMNIFKSPEATPPPGGVP